MTTTKNKYGRQVFLSREEIQYLRDLVYSDIVGSNDNLNEAKDALEGEYTTDKKFWEEQIEENEKRIKLGEKLVGDGAKKGDSGKLWYYIQSEEELGR